MHNQFAVFKAYLQFLPPEDQISKINLIIDSLTKTKRPHRNIHKTYSKIKELKDLRHEILLNLWMCQLFSMIYLSFKTIQI